jgi:hypothetical protein
MVGGGGLSWNWNELASIVSGLVTNQCGNIQANMSTNITLPNVPNIPNPNVNVLAALGLPWIDWGALTVMDVK